MPARPLATHDSPHRRASAPRPDRWSRWLPGLLVLCSASLTLAQDPGQAARPLVELVGREAGVVVEVSRLAEQLPAAAQSPLVGRLRELDLYRRWLLSDDYQKLLATRNQIESLLDAASLAQLVQDVFGESVVVAVYPAGRADAAGAARPADAPSDAAQEPAGILLTQASGADVLARTLSAWNAAERAEVVPLRHAGIEYVKRTVAPADDESQPPRTQFYVTLDRIFALSDHESAIRRTIELAGSNDPAASLAAAPAYQTARQSLAGTTVASAWVNPQVWEAASGQPRDPAPEASRTLPASGMLNRHVDSVIVGLRIDDGLVLEAVVHLEPRVSRDRWADFVEQAAGPADFLASAPRDALLVLAGRIDFTRAEELLSAQLPPDARRQWQMVKQLSPLLAIDFVNEVLPALGENWALYVVPREDPHAGAPLDVLFVFELADAPRVAGRSPAQDRLDRGLATAWERLARFLSQISERPGVEVQSRTVDSTVIRWVAGLGPYEPTCAVSDRALVLASSPAAAERLLQLAAAERLAAVPAFEHWHRRYLAGRNPALYVNVAAARQWVSTHREFLARQAAADGRLSPEAAAERLERFDDLLKLLDAAFITVELADRHIRITAGGLLDPAP